MKVKCNKCGGKGVIDWPDPTGLKAHRIRAGLSLRKLADKLKVTAPYLHDIENGRRRCTPEIEEVYRKLK